MARRRPRFFGSCESTLTGPISAINPTRGGRACDRAAHACQGDAATARCSRKRRRVRAERGARRRRAREPGEELVAESGNIVGETASRIFADLADPQTVNRASNGAWKEPLWQALSGAGLTLAWIPEANG